jgi:hypothetical protein
MTKRLSDIIAACHMVCLSPSKHSTSYDKQNPQPFFIFSPTNLSTWFEQSLQTHNNVQQVLGRVIHIGVDAILISAVLAGIKRSTGLQ